MVFRFEAHNALPFFALVNTFSPFLFTPLPFILAALLRFRTIQLALAFALLFSSFAGNFGYLLLPKTDIATGLHKPSLRVITFNLGPGRASPEDTFLAIHSQNADVFVVQELTSQVEALFDAQFVSIFPHKAKSSSDVVTAIYSKHPIVSSQPIFGDELSRAYIHVQIDWSNQPVNILAAHPRPPDFQFISPFPYPVGIDDKEQQERVMSLANYGSQLSAPTIIVGDFNLSANAPAYQQIASLFVDSHSSAGWGFGFSFPLGIPFKRINFPFVRIDYIFHSDQFVTLNSHTNCDNTSDHCLLIADLILR